MPLNLFNIILVLIVFQSFLYAAILLSHRKGKKQSNRILATLLIVLGMQMTTILLRFQGVFVAPLEKIGCCYGLIYGVLLYFYTNSLIYRNFRFSRLDLLHLIPFSAALLLPLAGYDFCTYWGNLLYLSIISYLLACLYKIHQFKKTFLQTSTATDLANLSWLRLMLILFTLTLMADILQRLGDYFTIPFLDQFIGTLVMVLVLIFVNTMVYKGLKQPELFLGISKQEEQLVSGLEKTPVQKTDPELQARLHQLDTYMETAKPYLNPSLNLSELAGELNWPPKKLSQLINQAKSQNFSEYINHFRIEAAKERLKNPRDPKETILEVMYDVGFNSKSVFNTLFKKHTGMTPSEYKGK